jgi:hypothetical protein
LRAERFACLLAVSNTRVRKATKTRANRGRKKDGREILRRWLRMTFHGVGIAKIALRGDSRCQIKTRPLPKYFRFEVKSGVRKVRRFARLKLASNLAAFACPAGGSAAC